MDEYLVYRRFYRNNSCPGDQRDMYLDYAVKVESIRNYPFERILESFKKFAKSNKLQFDSLIMINYWHPTLETIDYSCPYTFFKIYSQGNVKSYQIILADFGTVVESIYTVKAEDDFMLYLMNSNFRIGCDFGYISYTKFDKRWNWEIGPIVINPSGLEPSFE